MEIEFDVVMKALLKRAGVVILFLLASGYFFSLLAQSALLDDRSSFGYFMVITLFFFVVACIFGYSLLGFIMKANALQQVIFLVARERDEEKLMDGLYIQDLVYGVVYTALNKLSRHDLVLKYQAYLKNKHRKTEDAIHSTERGIATGHFYSECADTLKTIEALPTFSHISKDLSSQQVVEENFKMGLSSFK